MKHNWIKIVKTTISCIPLFIATLQHIFEIIKEVYSEKVQKELEIVKQQAKEIKEELKKYDNNVNAQQSE